ncbi:hypothetical protein ACQQ2Q_13745 [Agrobacterium sp. ES01]|uniref:hypothetical protein n=1 Tax=Agrobacterium sp. ES01 TaxID=3420714 RepID=UPI003D0BF825
MTMARQTTDHAEIRNWIEARNGMPAKVNGSRDEGVLGVEFDKLDDDDRELKKIEWTEFFQIFEGANLAFLCQDNAGSGNRSHFNKFVERE